ncbi:MAG TPA: peptidase [Rheinheimera sp.]|nr:peptidase [Rheinheimera sp.]
MKLLHLVATGLVACTLLSCAKSPTGRSQLLMFDQKQVDSMGLQSFSDLKTKSKINKDKKINQYVQCVANQIIKVTPAKYQLNPWEIVVFEDDQVNAFALPGGKIGVYTGLLLVADNQHQLAAVIGHEVGHVMAEHANERLSSSTAMEGIMNVADVALTAMNTRYKTEISGALGLGAQLGVMLPYSRAHESEADTIGLDLMARAGFNPDESVKLWQNMEKNGSGGTPQLLSTHPSPENRIKALQGQLPKVAGLYQYAKQQGKTVNCAK